jgi:hypothetical protein
MKKRIEKDIRSCIRESIGEEKRRKGQRERYHIFIIRIYIYIYL